MMRLWIYGWWAKGGPAELRENINNGRVITNKLAVVS